MNRKLLLLCALTLPLFFFGVVAQSMAYRQASRQLESKLMQQDTWIEKNKRLMAGVAVLQSPSRIEELASGKLGLFLVGASGTIKVRFTGVSP
jgi:cell division protein FtsL